MKTITKKLYEAMFLVDSAKAAADWEGVQRNIRNILERGEAEIVSIRKWDERKLAYDIGRHSRGTYVLCYFNGNGRKNADIERSAQLSDQIIRVLILSAEHLKQEDIAKDTPATAAERSQMAVETDRASGEQVDREEAHDRRHGRALLPDRSEEDRISSPDSSEGSEQTDEADTGDLDELDEQEQYFESEDESDEDERDEQC